MLGKRMLLDKCGLERERQKGYGSCRAQSALGKLYRQSVDLQDRCPMVRER